MKDDDATMELVTTLQASVFQRSVRSVSFSPCGRMLAACGFDGITVVWHVPAEALDQPWPELTCLEGHENEAKCVAWSNAVTTQSNDSAEYLLATCGRDKAVWIWSLSLPLESDQDLDFEADCMAVLQEHQQDVKSLAWHPSLPMLASCSADQSLRVWKEDSGECEWLCASLYKAVHENTIWDVKFDYSGRLLATCSQDGLLKVWHFDGLQCLSMLSLATRPLYSLCWCAERTLVIASGQDSLFVVTLDANDPSVSIVHEHTNAHLGDVNCVSWNPSLKLLASAGDDKTIRLWDLEL